MERGIDEANRRNAGTGLFVTLARISACVDAIRRDTDRIFCDNHQASCVASEDGIERNSQATIGICASYTLSMNATNAARRSGWPTSVSDEPDVVEKFDVLRRVNTAEVLHKTGERIDRRGIRGVGSGDYLVEPRCR